MLNSVLKASRVPAHLILMNNPGSILRLFQPIIYFASNMHNDLPKMTQEAVELGFSSRNLTSELNLVKTSLPLAHCLVIPDQAHHTCARAEYNSNPTSLWPTELLRYTLIFCLSLDLYNLIGFRNGKNKISLLLLSRLTFNDPKSSHQECLCEQSISSRMVFKQAWCLTVFKNNKIQNRSKLLFTL